MNSLYVAAGLCVVAIIALAGYSWHLDPDNFVKNMRQAAAYYVRPIR